MKDFIILIETSIIFGCLTALLLGYEEWWQYVLCITIFIAIILVFYIVALILFLYLAYRWYKKQDANLFSIINNKLKKYPLTRFLSIFFNN